MDGSWGLWGAAAAGGRFILISGNSCNVFILNLSFT